MKIKRGVTVVVVALALLCSSKPILLQAKNVTDQQVIDQLYYKVPELRKEVQALKESTFYPYLQDRIVSRPDPYAKEATSRDFYEIAIAQEVDGNKKVLMPLEAGKYENWLLSKDFKTIYIKYGRELQDLASWRKQEKKKKKEHSKYLNWVGQTRDRIRYIVTNPFREKLQQQIVTDKKEWQDWIQEFMPELDVYRQDFLSSKRYKVSAYEKSVRSVKAPDKKSQNLINRTHYEVLYIEQIQYAYKKPEYRIQNSSPLTKYHSVYFYIPASLDLSQIWVGSAETNPNSIRSFLYWALKMQEIHRMNLSSQLATPTELKDAS